VKIIKIFKTKDKNGRQILQALLANNCIGNIKNAGVMLGENTTVCGYKCDQKSVLQAYKAYSNQP